MKLYRLILFGAAAGLLISGCTKEETPEGGDQLIDTGDELTLTASAANVILSESNGDKEALKLTWTPASDYGLDEEINYTLEITKDGADYSDGYSQDMGKTTMSKSWTNSELNSFLTEEFDAASGTAAKYKTRITATVSNREDLTQTAETEFSATTFSPTTSTLFIAGSALTETVPMTSSALGQFSWSGTITGRGSIIFKVSDETDWPAYGAGAEAGKLALYNEMPDSDVAINVEAGNYTITVDLLSLTYSIQMNVETLYIAFGDSFENAVQMENLGNGAFGYNRWIETGTTYRFLTKTDSWWPGFVKDAGSEDGTALRYFGTEPEAAETYLPFTYEGTSDYKRITANISDMTVAVTYGMPETLVIGGTALGDAWTWEEDRQMTPTETGFEWTGDLVRGSFRFAIPTDNYWPGYIRDGESEDYWTLSERVSEPYQDLGFDVHKAGKYTVTVNFETRKVDLICNEEHPDKTILDEHLYIVLNTAWNPDDGQEMINEGNGHFSWEGEITETGEEHKVDGGVFAFFSKSDPNELWWPRYGKVVSNDPDMKNRLAFYFYDPSTNIDVEEPGHYKIDVYLDTMTYNIEKLQ